MLTCCPNSMFLASSWLEIYKFSNVSFCWLWAVQNWCSFCYIWTCQNWPYLFSFTDFGQVTVILVSLGMRGGEKQSKLSQSDKNSRTKRRIWHFLNHFQWFNQQESRTGFLSQKIDFNGLVIYFCNTFFLIFAAK